MKGSIGFSVTEAFKITLNGTNEYIVYINDPRFGFPTLNPDAVSRTCFLMSRNTTTILYLKVTSYLSTRLEVREVKPEAWFSFID